MGRHICVDCGTDLQQRGLPRQSDEVPAEAEDSEIIAKARELYCTHSDDAVEIDSGALVSRNDEGAWVSAWVYVRFTAQEEEEID